jgi:hypothetical protein
MMLAMDRNDPIIQEAMEHAARVSEWLVEKHNSDVEQELALDVLADFITGIDDIVFAASTTEELRDPKTRLAWALVLTEKRTDLEPHEQRLLDEAWERVRELQLQREWEEMGL